ncbi:MAG: DUF4340 domain-containing protein, partial [Verrucomicrobiota bacterium]
KQPHGGEQVLVLQNQLAEAMDKDLNAWREKRVFPLVVPEVTELWMRQGAVEVEIQKTPEGAWVIRKPVEAPADPATVNSVLGEISALRAAEFVADSEGDLALYGLTAPAQSFEVKTQATNRVLQIGQANPKDTNQVFARMADRPFVFTLPKSALDPLSKLPERVRDRRLATFGAPSLISQIEFGGRGGEYRLEKQGDGWVASWGGSNRAADPARVNRWLDAVLNSRANRFLATEDPAKLGFAKPRVTATLSWPVPSTNGTTMKTETLSFGEETKDEVYVQNSAITGTMATTVALIRETPENAMGWLERRLLPKDFGSVRGLIWSAGGQRREYRAGEDGRWRATGAEADVPEAAGYATRILDLEVIRWSGAQSAAPGGEDLLAQARELQSQGQLELADKLLTQARQKEPQNQRIQVAAALLAEAREDTTGALARWRELIRASEPGGAVRKLALARAHLVEERIRLEQVARLREETLAKQPRKLALAGVTEEGSGGGKKLGWQVRAVGG